MPSPHFSVEQTMEILQRLDKVRYEDEAVSQLQHALQSAQFARDSNCDDEVVAAALLHDIGRAPEVVDHYGSGVHERVGAKFCADHISDRAAFLVGQHVPAKRYLVATRPTYIDTLSSGSLRSLRRQGGPMNAGEVAEFESQPLFEAAAELRRWDDSAKDQRSQTDDLQSYADALRRVWASDDS